VIIFAHPASYSMGSGAFPLG